MGKSTPPPFAIHVDGSCLTDTTDLEQPKQREASSDTIVHNPVEDEAEQTPSKPEQSTRADLFDEKIQAQIHEAARKVVADIERARYDEEQEDSILSSRTDESYSVEGTELTHDETELTYDGTEAAYETDHEEHIPGAENELDSQIDQALDDWEPDNGHAEDEQDSSSHHEDVDDDVFSEESGRSQRSSMNSIHDLISSDEAYQKELASPAVGEEAATSHPVSRIPSIASYTPDEPNMNTPSKVLHRPPFRTPSSVRAMQMTSPTPSIFASPRSTKRHHPTGSRIGTPTSQYSPSKRTPTRFKAKKEEPLVLLHVTVMPLQWPYSHAMTSRDIPESLQGVKENWGLLQDKLADTVLERGVLLPHPQDSYEVLEERLLDALELPVRPRATILKCGHYMGPLDVETPSSDDENTTTTSYFRRESGSDRKWCDICRKDVKLEETGETCGKRRFNVKIYASNGLMRAGAWAACWREMERVDVEIEPWVESNARGDLDELAASAPPEPVDEEDEFVDEEEVVVEDEKSLEEELPKTEESNEHHQSAAEKEIIRKFEEEELKHRLAEEEKIQVLLAEEKALQEKMEQEEQMRLKTLEEQKMREILDRPSSPSISGRSNHSRRTTLGDDRMREIYGRPSISPSIGEGSQYQEHIHHQPSPQSQSQQRQQRMPQTVDPDSLPDLLFAAFKVLLRDKKNIAIGFLSILVLLLALKPHTSASSSAALVEQAKVLTTEVTPEVLIEGRKGLGAAKENTVKEQEVVSYVTVTATATATVEAEPVVVTMTKEVIKEAATAAVAVDLHEEISTEEEGDVTITNSSTLEEVQGQTVFEDPCTSPKRRQVNEDTVIPVVHEATVEVGAIAESGTMEVKDTSPLEKTLEEVEIEKELLEKSHDELPGSPAIQEDMAAAEAE